MSGFIQHGPRAFFGKNINTGTYTDEFGFTYKDSAKKIAIARTLKILELVSEYGIQINSQSIKELNFKSFFINLKPKEKENLKRLGINEDYDLNRLYGRIKTLFCNGNKNTNSAFEEYQFDELKKLGILDSNCINDEGFLIKAPKKFQLLNINTGTRLDENGKPVEFYYGTENGVILDVLDIIRKDGLKIDNNLISENICLADLMSKLSQNAQNKLNDLKLDKFDLKSEYELIKYKFKYSEYSKNDIFASYELEDLKEMGLCEKFNNYRTRQIESIVDDKGFILPNTYARFEGYNIFTLKKYSVDGYDCKGRDYWGHLRKIGYNKFGFNKKGINFNTGDIVDEYQFNVNGEYCIKDENGMWVSTGKMVNPNGFNIARENFVTGSKLDLYYFDIDGYYMKDKRKKELRENPLGFRADKTHKDTGTVLNSYNFDINGHYHELQQDGSYKNTKSLYDPKGFDIKGINKYTKNPFDETGYDRDGYDKYGFNKNKIHKNGTLYDDKGFNFDGYFCEKNEVGEYVVTNKKLNKYNFDREGFFWKKNQRTGIFENTKSLVNQRGFDIDGDYIGESFYKNQKKLISQKNIFNSSKSKHRKIDMNNFDIDGYYYEKDEKLGLVNTGKKINPQGFNCNKKTIIITEAGKKEWSNLNKYNFDFYGDYYEKYNGEFHNTYRKTDPYGFNIYGINEKTQKHIDENYFDRDGFFWKKDFEKRKFVKTQSKVNERQFNRDGKYCKQNENGEYVPTDRTRDPDGYNIKGIDENGFNRKKIHIITKEIVDENGFNADGYYCEKNENMEYEVTNSKYNPRGFKNDGSYLETGRMYDDRKFNMEGTCILTGTKIDFRGFNAEGICVENEGSIYDKNGFKADKTYKETGLYFDENGYNCFGLDKNGLDKNGEYPDEVRIMKHVLVEWGVIPTRQKRFSS